MIIAIAGKGGVGKSTISSLLVRYLVASKKGSVLAVDADPNSNLGDFLGFPHKQDIGQLIDDIAKKPDQVPPQMGKDGYIDYRVQTTLGEAEGFDLLAMGKPEGPGCYCYANSVLRRVLSNIMSQYEYVVVDNEAGFEHLSRRTLKDIDSLIIVSDPTPIGLKAAKRIVELASALEIKFKKIYLLLNASSNKNDIGATKSMDLKIDIAGVLERKEGLSGLIVEKGILNLSEKEEIVKESSEIFDKIFSNIDQNKIKQGAKRG